MYRNLVLSCVSAFVESEGRHPVVCHLLLMKEDHTLNACPTRNINGSKRVVWERYRYTSSSIMYSYVPVRRLRFETNNTAKL